METCLDDLSVLKCDYIDLCLSLVKEHGSRTLDPIISLTHLSNQKVQKYNADYEKIGEPCEPNDGQGNPLVKSGFFLDVLDWILAVPASCIDDINVSERVPEHLKEHSDEVVLCEIRIIGIADLCAHDLEHNGEEYDQDEEECYK